MGNKKNARKKAAKSARGPPIDVDESVASAIIVHVPDIRDRLALGCVSKVWRVAGSSPGC